MSFERVLVPVDFSADAEAAARQGIALAAPGGQVTLLFADDLPDLGVLAGHASVPSQQTWAALRHNHTTRLAQRLEALRSRLAEHAPEDVQVVATLRSGKPVAAIVAGAARLGAELIVMASHGTAGSVRFLFGSTSARVAREAPAPVLVIRPEHGSAAPALRPFCHALAAVDYSPLADGAIRAVERLLPAEGALDLLHAWRPPRAFDDHDEVGGDERQLWGQAVESLREAELERMRGLVDAARRRGEGRLAVAGHLAEGEPAGVILAEARRLAVDVIAVGAHGRQTLVEQVVGTVADRVLRHAELPVLLLPAQALASAS